MGFTGGTESMFEDDEDVDSTNERFETRSVDYFEKY